MAEKIDSELVAGIVEPVFAEQGWEPPEPEQGFGDGDGGPCAHPQCCVERSIEYSSNAIVEGMQAMAHAEWPISSIGRERLRALAEYITAMLDEEEGLDSPEIGIVHPLPTKDES